MATLAGDNNDDFSLLRTASPAGPLVVVVVVVVVGSADSEDRLPAKRRNNRFLVLDMGEAPVTFPTPLVS